MRPFTPVPGRPHRAASSPGNTQLPLSTLFGGTRFRCFPWQLLKLPSLLVSRGNGHTGSKVLIQHLPIHSTEYWTLWGFEAFRQKASSIPVHHIAHAFTATTHFSGRLWLCRPRCHGLSFRQFSCPVQPNAIRDLTTSVFHASFAFFLRDTKELSDTFLPILERLTAFHDELASLCFRQRRHNSEDTVIGYSSLKNDNFFLGVDCLPLAHVLRKVGQQLDADYRTRPQRKDQGFDSFQLSE